MSNQFGDTIVESNWLDCPKCGERKVAKDSDIPIKHFFFYEPIKQFFRNQLRHEQREVLKEEI